LKTLAILSRKGGTGKTTLALHLAVAAESSGITTAVFDLDPQASAVLWADHRGEPFPAVIAAQGPRLSILLDQARTQSAELVILDTPPEADAIASEAVEKADAILIPCRPSALDLGAINTSVRIARVSDKPFFVVINAAPSQGREVSEMRAALATSNIEIAPVVLHQRKAFAAWMQQGRTAQEFEPHGKAAAETHQLLLWLCEKAIMLPRKLTSKLPR